MKVDSAEYVTSIAGKDEIMHEKDMQVAFLGRSNVGKSSLINTLVNRKSLARSSSSPGKTKRIYFYRINDAFYVVDLPGYGFAKVSGARKEIIGQMIEWYVHHEEFGVRKFVLIVDCKVGPTKDDVEVFELLRSLDKQIVVVANKVDKVGRSKIARHKSEIQKKLNIDDVFLFSARTREGLEKLRDELFS